MRRFALGQLLPRASCGLDARYSQIDSWSSLVANGCQAAACGGSWAKSGGFVDNDPQKPGSERPERDTSWRWMAAIVVVVAILAWITR